MVNATLSPIAKGNSFEKFFSLVLKVDIVIGRHCSAGIGMPSGVKTVTCEERIDRLQFLWVQRTLASTTLFSATSIRDNDELCF